MPKYRDKRTGRVVEAASPEEAKTLFRQSPRAVEEPPKPAPSEQPAPEQPQSFVGKAWDWANKPLLNQPAEWGAGFAKKADVNSLQDVEWRQAHPWRAALKDFGYGSVQGLGETVSGLTSPLGLGLTALTAGEGAAAGRVLQAAKAGKTAVGAARTARALATAERATGLGLQAHGAYKMVTGEGLQEKAGGLFEFAGGGVARHHGSRIMERAGTKPKVSIPTATSTQTGGALVPKPKLSEVISDADIDFYGNGLLDRMNWQEPVRGKPVPSRSLGSVLNAGDLEFYGKDVLDRVNLDELKQPLKSIPKATAKNAPKVKIDPNAAASPELVDTLRRAGVAEEKLKGLTHKRATLLKNLMSKKVAAPAAAPAAPAIDDLAAGFAEGERAVAPPGAPAKEAYAPAPFPSVGTDEGWGIMQARNRDVVTRTEVPVEQLVGTQSTVTPSVVEGYKKGYTEIPTGVSKGGKVYITGGHHRLAADIANGKKVVTLDVSPWMEGEAGSVVEKPRNGPRMGVEAAERVGEVPRGPEAPGNAVARAELEAEAASKMGSNEPPVVENPRPVTPVDERPEVAAPIRELTSEEKAAQAARRAEERQAFEEQQGREVQDWFDNPPEETPAAQTYDSIPRLGRTTAPVAAADDAAFHRTLLGMSDEEAANAIAERAMNRMPPPRTGYDIPPTVKPRVWGPEDQAPLSPAAQALNQQVKDALEARAKGQVAPPTAPPPRTVEPPRPITTPEGVVEPTRTVQPPNDINSEFEPPAEVRAAGERAAIENPPPRQKPGPKPAVPDRTVEAPGAPRLVKGPMKMSRDPAKSVAQIVSRAEPIGDPEFDTALARLKVLNTKLVNKTITPEEFKAYKDMAQGLHDHPGLPDETRMRWDELVEAAKAKRESLRGRATSEVGAVGKGVKDLMDQEDLTNPVKEKRTKARHVRFSKSVNPKFDAAFQDWVNARHAGSVEGEVAGRQFKNLDAEEMDAIHRFQKGDRSGDLQAVADYFGRKHTEMTEAGIDVKVKRNYVRQMWDNSPEEVRAAARRLGLKPSLAMKSFFETYEAGEAEGLKPRFRTMSKIVSAYEKMANKAIADRKFFNFLMDNNYLKPVGKAPRGWQQITNFPIKRYLKQNKRTGKWIDKGSTSYAAPANIADSINNYLNQPEGTIHWLADKASLTKNIALSSGVPFTGINAHGFNIAFRNMAAKGAKGLGQGFAYMVNPKMAANYLDKNLEKAPFFIRHGLSLTSEEHAFGTTGSTKLAKYGQTFLKWQGKMFEDPLFQRIIPALKLEHVQSVYEQLRASGLEERAAARQAAQTTNNFFGGINWEEMQRSRGFQDFMRTFVLAPDWFETTFRMGGNMAKSVVNPTAAKNVPYRNAVRNMVAAYFAANLLNKQQTGHWMWENDPGHAFDIEVGTSKGPGGQTKKRYVRFGGTAADMLRLPADVVGGFASGKSAGELFRVFKNRLSIPAAAAGDLFFNTSSQNQPIYGKDRYGRPIPMRKQLEGIGREAFRPGAPQYLKGPYDYMTGRVGAEEALAGVFESPLRYGVKPTPKGRRRSLPRASRR